MKIGFIGLGMMGSGMASNLQKAGHDLVVHDLTRQAASKHLNAGAAWADSPRAVAAACDLVFTSLPTPADVQRVGTGDDGLIHGFRNGAAWFDLSTNAVDVVRSLHATLAEKGIDFLDAPVSGGPRGANSGKLAIWVGGDQAVYDKYHAALSAMGDQAAYIGPIGAGSIAKLVHNASRRGTAGVVPGRASGRVGPQPDVRSAVRPFPDRQLRPRRLRPAPAAQGRVSGVPIGA